jgi:hypothetical protein
VPASETQTQALPAGGVLAVPDSSPSLVGIDTKTGDVLWTVAKASQQRNSPIATRIDGQPVFLAPGDGLKCIDARTGDLLWRYPNCRKVSVSGTHCVIKQTLSKTSKALTCLKLSLEGAEKVWSNTYAGMRFGHHLIHSGRVYESVRLPEEPRKGGRCRVLDLATGEDVGVSGRKLYAQASSICGYDKFIFVNEVRTLSVWDAETLKPICSIKGLVASTSPVIAGGRLYIRTSTGVSCYELKQSAGEQGADD